MLHYLLPKFFPGWCSGNYDSPKAAVDVARRGARMFEKVNVPIVGVVENMSYLLNEESGKKNHLFGEGGGAATAQALGCPFLGEILHEEVRLGGDHGTPWWWQIQKIQPVMKFIKLQAKSPNYFPDKVSDKKKLCLREDRAKREARNNYTFFISR